ncbi:hypothetical protein [Pseudogemmobacter humi]|uniref:Uncharacterized protein n=1 Tax=Pseudogemmobacter humi TaxID=2483812 RepID=A0A3P5X666_9RHOB|nr:hypothetical protein [Pseudogemmobacter humi]VDC26752.1 hypothetical protein XINFAN_01748 [Pseudogemmobacter humi]
MIICDGGGVPAGGEDIPKVIGAELMGAAGCPVPARIRSGAISAGPGAAIRPAIADARGVTWPEGPPERAAALPGKKAVVSSIARLDQRLSPERCGLTGFQPRAPSRPDGARA